MCILVLCAPRLLYYYTNDNFSFCRFTDDGCPGPRRSPTNRRTVRYNEYIFFFSNNIITSGAGIFDRGGSVYFSRKSKGPPGGGKGNRTNVRPRPYFLYYYYYYYIIAYVQSSSFVAHGLTLFGSIAGPSAIVIDIMLLKLIPTSALCRRLM